MISSRECTNFIKFCKRYTFCKGCPSVGPCLPCRLFAPHNFLRQRRPCVRSVLAVRPWHGPSVQIVKPHHYHQRRQHPNKFNYRVVVRCVPPPPTTMLAHSKQKQTRKQKWNL